MVKLSIVIPTKNRSKYAISVAETILKNFGDRSYEIVFCDNSDDETLEEYVTKTNSDKIVYKHYYGVVSFVDNFERALKLSTGEYVIFIGDDDIVTNNIFDLIDWMDRHDVKCVKYGINISYYWPGVLSGKSSNGNLTVRHGHFSIKKVNSIEGLKKMLKSGNYDYQDFNIPRLYHGLVRRDVLNEVESKFGKCFDGLSPDIYVSMLLGLVAKDFYIVNETFSVTGICKTSGSADSISGRHTGKLSDAPHFRGHNNYVWEERIPYIYTVHTIWAETAIKALSLDKENNILNWYNPKNYYLFLMSRYPMFRDELYKDYTLKTDKKISKINFYYYHILTKVRSFIRRGFIFIYRKLTYRKVYYNIESIVEALPICNNYLFSVKGIKDEK